MKIDQYVRICAVSSALLMLAACGGDDNSTAEVEEINSVFDVNVVNATHSQPLSPPAFILHGDGYSAWEMGEPVSEGLEELAESGAPDNFLLSAEDYALDQVAGELIMPGTNMSVTLSAESSDGLQLTVASMLVNTNDAFSGMTGFELDGLLVGESVSFLAPIYDAGTEMNDESVSSIPGPAAGGEGYNVQREARDMVTRHPGVVTADDGLQTSVLSEAHRFDGGAMLVTVTRTQ